MVASMVNVSDLAPGGERVPAYMITLGQDDLGLRF